MNKPKHHIFICSSSRPTGPPKGFCHNKSGPDIMANFMEEIDERGLGGEVLVTNTGCLGLCEKGPIIIVYPDNVWYKSVTVDDVEEIMDAHIEGGNPVKRLEL